MRQAQAEAAEWFARLQSDSATGEDWLAFEQWLGADPAHDAAFRAVELAWVDVEPVGRDAPRSTAIPRASTAAVLPLPLQLRPQQRRLWAPAAAAAALVAIVGVAAILPRPAGVPTRFAASAVSRDVPLPGGGTVRLRPGAVIDLRGSHGRLDATLVDGQARFQVRHDPGRRFIVTAGDATILDVGTVFDLSRSQGGEVRLTVSEGEVDLGRIERPGNVLRVSAGEAAVSRAGEGGPHRTGASGGPLLRIYRDAPLSRVVDDLNRVYTRPVRLAPDAGSLRFTGVLQMDEQNAVIRRLAAFMGLVPDNTSERILLHKAAKTAP